MVEQSSSQVGLLYHHESLHHLYLLENKISKYKSANERQSDPTIARTPYQISIFMEGAPDHQPAFNSFTL